MAALMNSGKGEAGRYGKRPIPENGPALSSATRDRTHCGRIDSQSAGLGRGKGATIAKKSSPCWQRGSSSPGIRQSRAAAKSPTPRFSRRLRLDFRYYVLDISPLPPGAMQRGAMNRAGILIGVTPVVGRNQLLAVLNRSRIRGSAVPAAGRPARSLTRCRVHESRRPHVRRTVPRRWPKPCGVTPPSLRTREPPRLLRQAPWPHFTAAGCCLLTPHLSRPEGNHA